MDGNGQKYVAITVSVCFLSSVCEYCVWTFKIPFNYFDVTNKGKHIKGHRFYKENNNATLLMLGDGGGGGGWVGAWA